MTQELTDEQKQQLQEKLKNMSPEELREFQKQQCIFCQIVDKKVQSLIVYEDDLVLGVLDINPAAKGHVLLIPKEHYAISPQIPDSQIGKFFVVAKKLSHSVLKTFRAHGTSVFVANGLAAGQRAQHFMIHIIPRYEEDGLMPLELKDMPEEDIAKVAQALRPKVKEQLGSVSGSSASDKDEKQPAKQESKQEESSAKGGEDKPAQTKESEQDSGSDAEDVLKELGKEDEESDQAGDESQDENDDGDEDQDSEEKEEGSDKVNLDDIADLFK